MEAFSLTLADREFYMPLERAAEIGPCWEPAGVPEGWGGDRRGVWTYWHRGRIAGPEQGWKVHVSTTRERAQSTLDTVAAACFALDVPFKHLAAPLFFTAFHHKHASRAQAGKFTALYPPDLPTARLLMERLAAGLRGVTGPYVLTDRPFQDSGVVFYRYGAHRGRQEVRADGQRVHMVRDSSGRDTEDVRSTSFVLPPGVEDPFAPPPERFTGPILLNDRFEVTEVIRHSNGGGAYRATDTRTGRAVFVKEARPYNGLLGDGEDSRDRLRREHGILRAVHAADPGLCPEPVDFFTAWDHDYLVTELVPGTGLVKWVAAATTTGRLEVEPDRVEAYYDRLRGLLACLRDRLDRLHALGWSFGDLSHGNVLVQSDDTVRLIDFETATRLDGARSLMGTPGYKPSAAWTAAGATDDDYGFAALALCGLFPLHQPLERDPAGRLELYRRDVGCTRPVPDDLWLTATRFHGRVPGDAPADTAGTGDDGAAGAAGADTGTAGARPEPSGTPGAFRLPTAAELDAEPERALARLRDGLTAGTLDLARPGFPAWVFPPSPRGLALNTVCLELGTAGVLYALHHSGTTVPAELVARLRTDALRERPALAPGLQTGLAGIAWTLGDLGLDQEAEDLLDDALRHPLGEESARLATGSPGIGMAALARHAATGDDARLAAAARIGDRLLRDACAPVLDGAGSAGLADGLAGTALFLHHLAEATGDERHRAGALTLAHAELDRAREEGDDGLRFADAGRIMPHLATGAAGVATVLTGLAAGGDERSAEALPELLRICRMTCGVEAGLYAGVAGWVFALAGYAEFTGRPEDRACAVRVATGLAKYATRHPGGLRILGSYQTRYQADLASGGAGVALALARLLDGPRVRLLTPATGTPAGVPVV